MPRRRLAVLASLVALLVGVAAVTAGGGGDGSQGGDGEPGPFDPTTWMPDSWQIALGGDPPAPEATRTPAIAWDSRLDASDIADLDRLGREVALWELTGEHPAELTGYFARNHPVTAPPPTPPSGAATRHCTDVEIRAVSGVPLPVGDAVKLLVIWRARCPFPPPSAGPGDLAEAISFLYARPVTPLDPLAGRWGGWVPAHPLAVPGAAAAARGQGRVPSAWELEAIEGCVDGEVTVRGELVYAWAALCTEATATGIPLVATDGFRSPDEQQRLWKEAVDRWGAEEARRRIAFSDGEVCLSRHCAGEAIDIRPEPAATAWLRAVVGCLVDGRFSPGDGTGCEGQTVSRVARYGFAFTIPTSPGHLDYLAGTIDLDAEWYGDCTPGPVATADLVRLVFTCRAVESGLPLEVARQVGSEAEVVARCTSALNPASVAYGGRYVAAPNPETGVVDDRTGLFGLSAAVADNHVIGGAAARGEAWANVDGAARLFAHERAWGRWGWDPFGCAAGDDGAGITVLD